MKLNNLFSALLLLAAASTAEAKPVYLQCDESKVLEDSFVINTSGKITNRTPDLNTWKNIPVFINAEAAKATVWGRAYELTATPTYYRLRSETDEVDRDLNGTRAERSRKVYEINRADLSYEYSSLETIRRRGLVSQSSESSRKSQGVCRISQPSSNNKI